MFIEFIHLERCHAKQAGVANYLLGPLKLRCESVRLNVARWQCQSGGWRCLYDYIFNILYIIMSSRIVVDVRV